MSNTVTVLDASGKQIGGSYSTITDALTAASAGDTVLIGNGIYTENVALKAGVNLEGESQASVLIIGTMSTPANFDNVAVSNLTVDDGSSTAMLLDMTGTQEVTSSAFSNVTLNLLSNSSATILIGNGQVAGSMALQGTGLAFSNVTMNSNDNNFAASTSFAYTLFHSVGGAQLVLNGVSLNGTASGTNSGLGAQWNMSPNTGETADVTIENSSTSGGGNFYVSGMASATITNNTFNGQGLALNGVASATVTGNTFENIDGTFNANGTQHRGLTIENAWGATGDSDITVENNTFSNITASDGAIAFQRWTDSNGNLLLPATIAQLNNIDIQSNTFTGVNTPVYLNPGSFNSSTVIPDSFTGSQLIIGTAGADTINDTSTGPMTIFGGGGGDTINGGSGNTTYYASQGDTITDAGGTDTVVTTGNFTLPANVENLTLIDGDSNTQTFDNMPVGPITNGEDGWEVLDPGLDQGIVDLGNGNHAFRMSSDTDSGGFSGPYSPALSVAAGELDAGAQFDGESVSFTFQAVSATPDGSRLEIDFANAGGTDRNSFLAIEYSASTNGIRIATNTPVLNSGGNFANNDFSAFTGNETLATGIDPTVAHTLTMQLAYVDGQNNDVINVYLDGQFIGTTTTFENYHDDLGGTHLSNAQANLTDRVIFRSNANGAPQTGQGFNIDNLSNSVYNNGNGTGNNLNNVITGNDGNNVLTGLGGNDTLVGGGGLDTANYLGTLTASDFSYDSTSASWIVNATNDGQSEGTDTLTGISLVTDGGGDTFLLVGGGSEYATANQAFTSPQFTSGEIIITPTPTSSVSITSGLSSNLPTAGTPLQATVSFTQDDSAATPITYTWFVDGNQAQSGTSSSFTPTEADVGAAITIDASFTDVFDQAILDSSAATGSVLDAAPTVTVPIIAGIAQVGQTLTASATATPADDTLTFDWFSSADNFTSPIATGATFKVTATGVSLEVEAIAANANGVQTTATSAAIATAAAPPPAINFPHVAGSNVDEWILASGQWTASAQPGSIPSGYVVAGIGDFTGSGTSDILWQNSTTGDTQEWLLNNGAYNGTVDLGAHPGDFKIAGVGDFAGNGIDDVLWTSSTSSGVQTDIWELSSSGQWQASVSPGSHPAGYNVVGVGDFNGNGTSDILWQNPTTGDVDEWQIADGQWSASVDLGSHPGTGWTIAGVGDFTGNGIDDILWTNTTGGQVQTDIWELGSNGQWAASVSPGSHPAGYQVAAVGNFADTGTDGILWYDSSTGDADEWQLSSAKWAASVDLGTHPGGFQIAGVGALVSGNATSDVLWQKTS